jgi:hypothetical protein
MLLPVHFSFWLYTAQPVKKSIQGVKEAVGPGMFTQVNFPDVPAQGNSQQKGNDIHGDHANDFGVHDAQVLSLEFFRFYQYIAEVYENQDGNDE